MIGHRLTIRKHRKKEVLLVQNEERIHNTYVSGKIQYQNAVDILMYIILLLLYIHINIKKRRAAVSTNQKRLGKGIGTDVVPMEQMWFRWKIYLRIPVLSVDFDLLRCTGFSSV